MIAETTRIEISAQLAVIEKLDHRVIRNFPKLLANILPMSNEVNGSLIQTQS